MAAPFEVMIGDQKELASPLTVGDLMEFTRWVQERTATLRGLAGDRNVDALIGMTWSSPEALAAMDTYEGMTRLVALAVRKHNRNMTHDRVVNTISSTQLVEAYLAIIKTTFPTVKNSEKTDSPKDSASPA